MRRAADRPNLTGAVAVSTGRRGGGGVRGGGRIGGAGRLRCVSCGGAGPSRCVAVRPRIAGGRPVGPRGRRPGAGGAPGGVEEEPGDLDAADAVADGVVEPEDHRRPVAVQAVDDGQRPRRARRVERGRRVGLGHRQGALEVTADGPHAPDVVGERDLAGVLPARPAEAERRAHDPLAEPGHHGRGPTDRRLQALGGGRAVERADHQDR
jgi:hypothetical protein